MHDLSRQELTSKWEDAWGKKAPPKLGRKMMLLSLQFRQWESDTSGLNHKDQKRLDKLISSYKSNPNYFEKGKQTSLTVGTRIIKTYKGKKHIVTVLEKGFDYEGQTYSSLSKLAFEITGTKWNGRVFFNLNPQL